jgi:hypothetical protein
MVAKRQRDRQRDQFEGERAWCVALIEGPVEWTPGTADDAPPVGVVAFPVGEPVTHSEAVQTAGAWNRGRLELQQYDVWAVVLRLADRVPVGARLHRAPAVFERE